MSYNFAVVSFHTKKLCIILASSEVRFFTEIGRFVFSSPPPPLWYDDRLRLIGKRVLDFLFKLIELLSLDVMTEALRAIIGSKSAILPPAMGPVEPKFQVQGVAPTNHFSSK